MPIVEAEFQGDVGPDLAGVGSRYDAGELRLRVVDAKRLNPSSVMPAYHRVDGLHRVLKEYRGKPILNEQEVEDVVAYLMPLTENR
jgi:sulfur-oxidizing protein SoxX